MLLDRIWICTLLNKRWRTCLYALRGLSHSNWLSAPYSHLGAIHILFSGIMHPMFFFFFSSLYTSSLLIGWEHQEWNILLSTNLGLHNGQTSKVAVCTADDDYFIAFNRKDSNERAKNLSVVSVAETPILDWPFKPLQSQRLCLLDVRCAPRPACLSELCLQL